MAGESQAWTRYPVRPLSGGRRDNKNPILLQDGESPELLNVDLDRDSVNIAGGAVKLGNRAAPKPGLRTRIDPEFAPLAVAASQSVPVRGYGYIPWSEKNDFGGVEDAEANPSHPLGDPFTEVFHTQRGVGRELSVSFKIPDTEKLYKKDTLGGRNDATPPTGWDLKWGFGEEMDEFTAILQKGGDRTSPMSWALGIVNVGRAFDVVDGSGDSIYTLVPPVARPSNYALCFVWYDAPKFGWALPEFMRYLTGDGQIRNDNGTGSFISSSFGEYPTMSLRAVVVEKWLKPGRTYDVSMQLDLDSGSPGTGAEPTTSWNADGSLKFHISEDKQAIEDFEYSSVGGTQDGIWVYKGPPDSLDYLTKYGVRYTSKDATFLGLGYRMAPWATAGFIPFGSDSSAMEEMGFSMHDLSDIRTVDAFGATYNLKVAHDNTLDPGGTFLEINLEGLARDVLQTGVSWGSSTTAWNGVAIGSFNPTGPVNQPWFGLGYQQTGVGTGFNSQALRGYRLVLTEESENLAPLPNEAVGGGLFTIDVYSATVGTFFSHRVTLLGDGWDGVLPSNDFEITPVSVRAFRWYQRDLVISDFRISSPGQDYTDPLVQFALTHGIDDTDRAVPNIKLIKGFWPLTDGGGNIFRDGVAGNDGFLCPFTLGKDEEDRCSSGLFLSGEGESLVLDLSNHAIFGEQFLNALKSGKGGFAIEFDVVLPEAYYAISQPEAGGDNFGALAPILASWSLKDPTASGFGSEPKELLRFGHRIKVDALTGDEPFINPMGFSLEASLQSDQQDVGLDVPGVGSAAGFADGLHAWRHDTTGPTNVSRWDEDANWVGRPITFQFGIEPTGTDDEYRIYIAAGPKIAVFPEEGDGGDTEFAYFVTTTVDRRDIERSVICIGGAFEPESLGYTEANARMLIKRATVYAAAAPGELPATTGVVTTVGEGKLFSQDALPRRELTLEDLLRPVAAGSSVAKVTEGSTLVEAAGRSRFFIESPAESKDAVAGAYLLIGNDRFDLPQQETKPLDLARFYHVDSVAADGASLTLSAPYIAPGTEAAVAQSFRVVGHTAFSDDLYGRTLVLGTGLAFEPGTTTSADASVTPEMFENKAALGGPRSPDAPLANWSFRVYSPTPGSSVGRFTPSWTRGLKEPRENPILGLYSLNQMLFAAAHGSVFEADDRWRRRNYESGRQLGIEFRNELRGNRRLPLEDDWLQLDDFGTTIPIAWALGVSDDDTRIWHFDLSLNSTEGIQSLTWIGSLETDPHEGAPSNELNFWLRINEGFPEVVISSDQAFDTGEFPDRGLYIARSDTRVPVGRIFLLRFLVPRTTSVLQEPFIEIDGKNVGVTVNATALGLVSPSWVLMTSLGQPVADATLLHGAAFDSVEESAGIRGYTAGTIPGRTITPQLAHGFQHPLRGTIWRIINAEDTKVGPKFILGVDIHPGTVEYGGTLTRYRINFLEQVGHRITFLAKDFSDVDANGVIEVKSHPLISLVHEMGSMGRQFSFQANGNEVFVTGGLRPFVLENGKARPAGIQPPFVAPQFQIERRPLWKANAFDDSVGDPENDPVAQLDPTTADEVAYHYNSHGNAYMVQAFHPEMTWEQDDYFAFKGYIRMRSVTGRIPIFSMRQSIDSGSVFVECRDGHIYIGWFDVALNEEVWDRTTAPVIAPGFVHYIHFRKRFPRQDSPFSAGSNWASTHWTGSFTDAYDVCTVRRFAKTAQSTSEFYDWTGFDAKPSVISAISFTGHDIATVPGTTATGRVTHSVLSIYTGAAGGVVTAGVSSFTPDMVGMLWQWADGLFVRDIFRVISYTSAIQVEVIDETGAIPDFSSYGVATEGGVYAGVAMEPSENFDDASQPSQGAYAVECFGSSLAGNPLSGIAAFDGESWSFAYGIFVASTGTVQEPDIFQDGTTPADASEIGADTFAGNIFSTTAPGELHVDDGFTFTAIDVQDYAETYALTTSQPNEDLEIEQDNRGAPPAFTTSEQAANLFWQRIKETNLFNETRRVRYTFYDPTNAEESDPSPELLIFKAPEEKTNPSGEERLVLTNLIPSLDRPNARWRIYINILGTTDLRQVAEIPAQDASSVTLVATTEEVLATGKALDFLAGVPPRCGVVAASQDSMWYLRLLGAEDTLAFSLPFRSERVPEVHILPLNTGENSAIVGAGELLGRQIIYKRNLLVEAVVVPAEASPSGLTVQDRTISKGTGAVSPQSIVTLDDRHYFIGAKGAMVMPGTALPIFIGAAMETYWRDDLDTLDGNNISAAINPGRDQFVFTTKTRTDDFGKDRWSIEFDHASTGAGVTEMIAGHRISRYSGPNLTALGNVDDKNGRNRQLVGGTLEGFVVWMDRSDIKAGAMMGKTNVAAGTEPHGARSLVVGVGSTNNFIVIKSGELDTSFAGPRGAIIRGVDSNGDAQEAVALFISGDRLYLDIRANFAGDQSEDDVITLGQYQFVWRSKDFDVDAPDLRKHVYWMDVTREPSSGTLKADLISGLSDGEMGTINLDLSLGFESENVSPFLQQARAFGVRFRSEDLAVDSEIELTDIVWRVVDQDQR